MIVMVCGAPRGEVHYLMGKYRNKLGIMCSPVSSNGWLKPKYYMQYAIDNGAFVKFKENAYFSMLQYVNDPKNNLHKPLFTVVPDVVGSHKLTLEKWHKYQKEIKKFGFNMAFVCQEGCTIHEIPKDADCLFIGGKSALWKMQFAYELKTTGESRWIHIGRVTTINRLLQADKIGVNSVDGNWFFGGPYSKQYRDFMEYFEGPLLSKIGRKNEGFFSDEELLARFG